MRWHYMLRRCSDAVYHVMSTTTSHWSLQHNLHTARVIRQQTTKQTIHLQQFVHQHQLNHLRRERYTFLSGSLCVCVQNISKHYAGILTRGRARPSDQSNIGGDLMSPYPNLLAIFHIHNEFSMLQQCVSHYSQVGCTIVPMELDDTSMP